MWLLGKVTIICVAQFVMIPRTHAKPHTFLNNNQAKGNNKHTLKKYLTSAQRAAVFKDSDTNSETLLNAFNFHDVEYPVAPTPRPQQFFFKDNQSPQRIFSPDSSNMKRSVDLKPAKNGTVHSFQKFAKPNIKNNENKPKRLSVPKAFTSNSGFRDVGNFPEVEYPLSAKETWKPNYWSIPSDHKDLNDLIAEDLQFNQNLANIHPKINLGIGSKSGKYNTFSIKSHSDIAKNKDQLKQILKYKANKINKKQNNTTFRNDFRVNSERNFTNDIQTSPIQEMVQELYTTVMPYYLTTIHVIPDCEENDMGSLNSNSLSIFNKTNQNISYSSLPIKNTVTLKIMKTNNPFTDNNTLLLNHNIQEIEYDPYDILDIRKPEAGSDLSDLDEDYTTDVYSEEQNIGWFSHPITTPSPFIASTVDSTWKNCKIITPCEYSVDELEDYYISV